MVTVSAIIPVYNHERYVAQAIDSVLQQTFQDFELIVVDDGSTDRSGEIATAYGDRLRYIRKENGGGASALNRGIREASGEWIAWLSSDDLWEPKKLELQMKTLETRPEAVLSYTDDVLVNAKGVEGGRRRFPHPKGRWRRTIRLFRRNFINGSSVVLQKAILMKVGPFDETNPYTPDFDMWTRIVPRWEVVGVAEALVRYRIHPEQASARTRLINLWTRRTVSKAARGLPALLGVACVVAHLVDGLDRAIRPRPVSVSDIWNRVREIPEYLIVLVNPAKSPGIRTRSVGAPSSRRAKR